MLLRDQTTLWPSECSIGVPSLHEARDASCLPTLLHPHPPSQLHRTVRLLGLTKACPTSSHMRSLLLKHPTRSCLPSCSTISTTTKVLPTLMLVLLTQINSSRSEHSMEVLGGALMRLTVSEKPAFSFTSRGWLNLMLLLLGVLDLPRVQSGSGLCKTKESFRLLSYL